MEAWSKLLSEDKLTNWLQSYSIQDNSSKTVAIIMAGNIPLVGFHDFLCVLITGHKVLAKQSSNDKVLLNIITKILLDYEPRFKNYIQFTEDQLSGFDAVIATGSNNTARYFGYYFGKFQNIIRKNRNSIAVLSGNESPDDLEALSDDIFRYYGLGCRNVSKLYVPEDYNFDAFFNAVYRWHPIIHERKYANNYDYNKAVYLMSEFDMLDNGFLVLRQDEQLSSPNATLNFEYYNSLNDLKLKLKDLQADIQCIVADGFNEEEVKFGQTQRPGLNTYADGVDTVEFLLKI
ncbi:MAG: acyl-CoA reductase [Bacteroidota bacterium]